MTTPDTTRARRAAVPRPTREGRTFTPSSDATLRPQARGKFLFVGDRKLYVRGVTYGTFGPDALTGETYHRDDVERDFAAIAARGMNAVRTYTLPPRWLLDVAQRHGLRVMVGMWWGQNTAFLDEPGRPEAIEQQVRESVRSCAGHPAVLCYAIANEIPAPIVRYLGHRRVAQFLARLCRAAKAEDPGGLVTYVNYPSTEYLRLPCLDLDCFNVYLESQCTLEAYLARLHNLAGDRPLLMGEIGLDSRRHGEEAQAQVLDWQVRTAFTSGCTGVFVFAWTDEWHCGGRDIVDWDFGITRRNRSAKPALERVSAAFADVPFARGLTWPRVSVVVCSHNGEATLAECLEGVRRLDYPDYEVIVVDDGSATDTVAGIARYFDVRLIRTENRGLSAARNTGCQAATGEIVAYLDDDAWPDPHWLTYLAAAFRRGGYAGVGGPNVPPPDDGLVAECVARSPGGPTHVLLSDREAEHIPGCNSAYRRDALAALGGFDPQFRAAGDDVDLCWRLRDRGWTLGFSPAALVWHHRRRSVHGYWRQQVGYGRAEAMLERKWPDRYNDAGHLSWAGRIYAGARAPWGGLRGGRIYHGLWGTALFQSLYEPAPGVLQSSITMPEWYLVILALASVTGGGAFWRPLLLTAPLLALAVVAPVTQAALSAAAPGPHGGEGTRRQRFVRYALTALLHLLQPLARFWGRLREGLTPWRRRIRGIAVPRPRFATMWSEQWRSYDAWLHAIEGALQTHRARIRRGGDFDRWDLEVRGGMFGAVRALATVEEHGQGRQFTRVRAWPRLTSAAAALMLLLNVLAIDAVRDGQPEIGVALSVAWATIAWRTLFECANAMCAMVRALDDIGMERDRRGR